MVGAIQPPAKKEIGMVEPDTADVTLGVAGMTGEPDSGYWRLEDQIRWYDGKAIAAQDTYKWMKWTQIVVAALIPVAALLFPDEAIVAGALGAVIVILSGFQELGAYHRNWIKYRTTCEALRHEKFLYVGRAGPYAGLAEDEAHKELVERVEALVSEENTQWTAHMETQRAKEAREKAQQDKHNA